MAAFQDLVRDLVLAYERDVGSLRWELEQCKRGGDGPAFVSAALSVESSSALSPRSPRGLAPTRSEGAATGGSQSVSPAMAQERQTSARNVVFELQHLDDLADNIAIAPRASSDNAFSKLSCGKSMIGNLQVRHVEKTLLEKLVAGPLEQGMGFVIILNVVLTLVQLQLHGIDIGENIERRSTSDMYSETVKEVFYALEHIFNIFFLFEITTRMFVLRGKFWYTEIPKQVQWFNIFDSTIVVFCSLDLYFTPLFAGGQSPLNLMFARVLRLARLARTLKVIQVLRAFSKLRILLRTVTASILSFTWSMIIVGILNLGGAIFICQMLQPTIEDETVDLDLRLWLFQMYGTSAKAVWTMFEFTFSGGWPLYARRVVEEVHWGYSIFFALYVSIVVFAVIRIITALFLKDTLNVAAKDADFMVQESMKAKKEYARKLEELFEVADQSGNGLIDFEEFRAICSIPEVIHYFHILELEVSEVHALFDLLDDGEGQISHEAFVRGVMRLKGTARSMDVLTVMRDCNEIQDRVRRLEEVVVDDKETVTWSSQRRRHSRVNRPLPTSNSGRLLVHQEADEKTIAVHQEADENMFAI